MTAPPRPTIDSTGRTDPSGPTTLPGTTTPPDTAGRGAPSRGATLSACVIARNEQQRLPDCLRSLRFCDEIVVVDSGSRDRTVEIAHEHGARVVEQPWLGFGAQRNVAIDHAHGDWILEVDADERVTPALREEIEAFLADPPAGIEIAGLPLQDIFLGGRLGPAAKYPKYRYRLFRRDAYRHDERRTVHEGLWSRGQAWAFAGDIEHLLAGSWREALHDAWTYAGLEAAQSVAPAGPRGYLVRICLRPTAKLLYRLVVDGGWHDGWLGIVKIALDCASDAAVGLRQLAGGGVRGEADGHFGLRSVRMGSVRLVALALGDTATRAARDWLERARVSGADVAIISDVLADANAPLRIRRLERAGPLALIRALDAEQQLRPIDALILFGPRARLLGRLLPVGALGVGGLREESADPIAVERELRLRTRGDGPAVAHGGAERAPGGPQEAAGSGEGAPMGASAQR